MPSDKPELDTLLERDIAAPILHRRHNSPYKLNTRHREIMRRLILGDTQAEISKDLGISLSCIYHVVQSPMFIAEMNRMQGELNERTYNALEQLRRLQPKAVEALDDIVTQRTHPSLRLGAAREILTRTGVDTPKEVRTFHQTMSYEERLTRVRQRYESGDREWEDKDPEPIKVIAPVGEEDDE